MEVPIFTDILALQLISMANTENLEKGNLPDSTPDIILPISEVNEVRSYPYGSLRTIAYFSVECMPGRGFRTIFQTINPKTNRPNNPKKGTYEHFAYCIRNAANGHIEFRSKRFYELNDINTVCKFITDNKDALQLKPEMIKDICGTAFNMLRISAGYIDADKDKLIAVLKPVMQTLVHGIKTGDFVFDKINLDVDAIEKLKAEFVQQSVEQL